MPDTAPVTDPGASAEPGIVPVTRSVSLPSHPVGIATTLCGTSIITAPIDSTSDIVVPTTLDVTPLQISLLFFGRSPHWIRRRHSSPLWLCGDLQSSLGPRCLLHSSLQLCGVLCSSLCPDGRCHSAPGCYCVEDHWEPLLRRGFCQESTTLWQRAGYLCHYYESLPGSRSSNKTLRSTHVLPMLFVTRTCIHLHAPIVTSTNRLATGVVRPFFRGSCCLWPQSEIKLLNLYLDTSHYQHVPVNHFAVILNLQ